MVTPSSTFPFSGRINTSYEPIHLYPGSWNPLHEGHMEIWKSVENTANLLGHISAFEISISRREKETLSLDDLEERVGQFKHNILITNQIYFKGKLQALININSNACFHIGFDTATRLLRDHSDLELEGYGCAFFVYSREERSWRDLERKPSCFLEGHTAHEAEFQWMSSTEIRNGKK